MSEAVRPLRSLLYLPASNPRATAKARTLDCDAVILDLEDAVAPDAKPDARAAAVAAARAGGWGHRLLAVRVNPLASRWGADDFAGVADAPVDAIVVPKVDDEAAARAALAAAGDRPVWAMIESPRGVLNAAAIAAVPGVAALIAGTSDLAKELRARPHPDRLPLLFALSAMLNAARAAGILAFDGVHAAIDDPDGVARTSAQGAALGFDGRTIVHPIHIAPTNAAYAPDAAALAEAHGLIAASEAAGGGVTTHRGRMIEALHVAEARRLLAFADAIAARDTQGEA